MRVANWPQELEATRLKFLGRTREYGRFDCWQWVAECVLAITGVDYRERFPAYTTRREGMLIIAEHGGVEAMISEIFGPSKHVCFAQRGDIVVCDLGDGLAGGVCFGVNTWTVSPAGLEPVPTKDGKCAWTV